MAFNQKTLGNNLIKIGDKEIATSQKLDDASRKLGQVADLLKANGRVDKSMGSIETGTRSTRSLLTPVGSALHFVADKLGDVTIPTFNINTRRIDFPVIGKLRFVTGVTVGSKHPFTNIANRIEGAADNIDNVAAALKNIADGIRDIHKDLPDIRKNVLDGSQAGKDAAKNLNDAGTLMKAAGHTLAD